MANLASAQKKVRKDIKKAKRNSMYRSKIDQILRVSNRTGETADTPSQSVAYKTIDKAAKRGILSKQKASRLKSQVASR